MTDEDRSVFDLPYIGPAETIHYGKSGDQVIDFYLPKDQKKSLVVLIHGGYWRPEYDRKHVAPLANSLAAVSLLATISRRTVAGSDLRAEVITPSIARWTKTVSLPTARTT